MASLSADFKELGLLLIESTDPGTVVCGQIDVDVIGNGDADRPVCGHTTGGDFDTALAGFTSIRRMFEGSLGGADILVEHEAIDGTIGRDRSGKKTKHELGD